LAVFSIANVYKKVNKIKPGVKKRNWELGLTKTKTLPATRLFLGLEKLI